MYMDDEIKKLTLEEANKIIESGFGSTGNKYRPRGLFYTLGIFNGKKFYVGIDNSERCAWTEDFKTLEKCKAWLRGETEE